MEKHLTINTPFKILQKNLWDIKKHSAEIESENLKLKGKLNSQAKWKTQTFKQSLSKKCLFHTKQLIEKLTEVKNQNKRLKQTLKNQQEQIQSIEESSHHYPKLLKKKRVMERALTKYTKIIQKEKNRQKALKARNQSKKQTPTDKGLEQELEIVERKNQELVREIKEKKSQLKEVNHENKSLNEEIIGLINYKNQLRKCIKQGKSQK